MHKLIKNMLKEKGVDVYTKNKKNEEPCCKRENINTCSSRALIRKEVGVVGEAFMRLPIRQRKSMVLCCPELYELYPEQGTFKILNVSIIRGMVY